MPAIFFSNPGYTLCSKLQQIPYLYTTIQYNFKYIYICVPLAVVMHCKAISQCKMMKPAPMRGCIITILVQENIYRVTGTCNSSFLFAIVDYPQPKDRDETVLYCPGFQTVYEVGH